MDKVDVAVVEPWDMNHYSHVPPLICDLLTEANINVGLIDYLDKIKDKIDYKIYKCENLYPPKTLEVNNFFEDLKKHLEFYDFYSELFEYIRSKTDNVILTTDSYPLVFTTELEKINFIVYIHDPNIFKIKPKHLLDIKRVIKPMIYRRYFKLANAIIVNEKRLEYIIKSMGVNKNIYNIPWISKFNYYRKDKRFGKFMKKKDTTFRLLNIGIIREGKNIEFLIDQIGRKTNHQLTIAGKPVGNYGARIEKKVKDLDRTNIELIMGYLSEEKYLSLIRNHDFIILAHDRSSEHSSGPMIDSFLNYRPIIAPNIYPFNHYIRKYKVGILYKPDEPNSLLKAVKKAKDVGSKHFYKNLSSLIDNRFNFLKLSNKMKEVCNKNLYI